MKKIFICALVLITFSGSAQPVNATSEMRDVIAQYQSDAGSLSRKYTLTESAEYYERFATFYDQWSKKLLTLPFETLPQGDKVDYILLRNSIERDRHELAQHKGIYESIKPALKFEAALMPYLQQRRHGKQFNGAQFATALTDIKKQIETNLHDIETGSSFTTQQSKASVRAVDQYRRATKDLFHFYDGYDPQFSWYVTGPYQELDSTFSRYSRFLKARKTVEPVADDGSGITGSPVGRAEIIKSLSSEFIPYTPEELMALANKEFAWCEAEMLKASTEMGFGKQWKDALEKVKNDFVEPGKQPELIEFLAEEATDYVINNNLVTVPDLARETWRMTMMSPERQKFNPFFLGGEEIQISYPTSTMAQADKRMSMRGNNKHFSRATVFHELIPGHHLQGYMTDRYNTQRTAFYTPFWTEGWALYWEMILWDKNFPKSPENRVGMLFWRMHRCARILFSLNYHMGKWTPQQCVDFLVDKVGHERANAEGEVRRSFMGGYGPLYQLAYMIGAKQFYALRKELVDSGKMKEKDYHDTILQSGPIPVELIRGLLTNQPLTRDFKTTWKFSF